MTNEHDRELTGRRAMSARFEPRRVASICALLALVAAASSATAQEVDFEPLGLDSSFEVHDVSGDGRVVVGWSEVDDAAFRWTADEGLTLLASTDFPSIAFAVSPNGALVAGSRTQLVFVGNDLVPFTVAAVFGVGPPGITRLSSEAAYGVTDAGVAVGYNAYGAASPTIEDAFIWSPASGQVDIGDLPGGEIRSRARAISADGQFVAGVGTTGLGLSLFRYDVVAARMVDLEVALSAVNAPMAMSADGSVIVGMAAGNQGFRWTHTAGDEGTVELFPSSTFRPNDVSADGRIMVGRRVTTRSEAVVWIDGTLLPLEHINVDEHGVDAPPWRLDNAIACSSDGLVILGTGQSFEGFSGSWLLRLPDCNGDGVPDGLGSEHAEIVAIREALTGQGTELFEADRDNVSYESMIAAYGRPWSAGSCESPALDSDPETPELDGDPAAKLRALLQVPECSARLEDQAADYFERVVLPAVHELHHFEMLLGNEAFSDAADATVGVDLPGELGAGEILGGEFAFRGVRGIVSSLDEELALLRGRDLSGEEDLDGCLDALFPFYNRLAPNAEGPDALAYQTNYDVSDNAEATEKFPQGHGDAFGYYLGAVKLHVDLFAGNLADTAQSVRALLFSSRFSEETLEELLGILRRMATAMAARARAAGRVVDLEFRKAYGGPTANDALFADGDPERAWSMVDWGRRGALGAYFDWALVNQVTPRTDTSLDDLDEPPAEPVLTVTDRDVLLEIAELPARLAEIEERVDAAGAGLDPVGLLHNVVPFGIDFEPLGRASGPSHYEQVREAAVKAISNSRQVLVLANEGGRRLRQQGDSLSDFSDRVAETKRDFEERLVEIFGYASEDDPVDNDLDPTTDDVFESDFRPDLVRFFLDDETLRAQGMRPRKAPGQIQLALSRVKLAELGIAEAEAAIDRTLEEYEIVTDRIELLTETAREEIEIIEAECEVQYNLNREMESLKNRRGFISLLSGGIGALGSLGSDKSKAPGLAAIAQAVGEAIHDAYYDNEFDIEEQRIRARCAKEVSLTGLRNREVIEAEIGALRSIAARLPGLQLGLAAAQESAVEAVGSLRAAVQRGLRLFRERQRVGNQLRDELIDLRRADLSFRVFRNSMLEKYGAYFELATRYTVLATRAFAYEHNEKRTSEGVVAAIYRERLPGIESGLTGGLQGVIQRLDDLQVTNNFNRSTETLGRMHFRLREHLFDIGNERFPDDDIAFRRLLEASIGDFGSHPVLGTLAETLPELDDGPAIILEFETEIDGRNFFGNGPSPPAGIINFEPSRNAKVRNFWVRFENLDAAQALGIDSTNGNFRGFLIPAGESIMREDTGLVRIDEELLQAWSVVDQFLSPPTSAQSSTLDSPTFSFLRDSTPTGRRPGVVKPFAPILAQPAGRGFEGPDNEPNKTLAGRACWNTRWILCVPGAQFSDSDTDEDILEKLNLFIWGPTGDPADARGVTNIIWTIDAYRN